jgi:hypothetical protein
VRWGGVGRCGCCVALVCVLSLELSGVRVVWRRELSLCVAPPQRVVCKAPLISEGVYYAPYRNEVFSKL